MSMVTIVTAVMSLIRLQPAAPQEAVVLIVFLKENHHTTLHMITFLTDRFKLLFHLGQTAIEYCPHGRLTTA